MPELKQYGLIIPQEQNPKDWRFGGVSGADKVVLREDGQYQNFLPKVEYQHAVYFDTMACVTFSALNCLEIYQNVRGINANYSDRFTAKMSGTTNRGNSLVNVAESIRKDGVIPEEDWAFPRLQRQPVFEWEDYYQEIPDELKMKGKRWALENTVQWEWIPMSRLQDALKYAPIQVTMRAGIKPNKDGLYTDGGSRARNHAVTLVGYKEGEYWEVFDHYQGNEIRRMVWDYDFIWAMQFTIAHKKINTNMIEIPNDTLVQEVEKSGTFGLHLNNKIMLGDEGKLLATWLMRNKGNTTDKVKPLTELEWNSFQKTDLRNNPV